MESTASRYFRAVPRLVGCTLAAALLTLASCSSSDNQPEGSGSKSSPIISLDPPAAVVAGVSSTRSATCPGRELPDQCGTWAGVELNATRTATPKHGWHHHECRHHGHDHHRDIATDDDEHCLCEPISFVIPAELPVTAGQAGGEWDKAELSFRTSSGKVVECEYRGNFEPRHGRHPASGGDKYVFERCNKGFKAGQTTKSDWFQLELGDGHGSDSNVAVSLRLGEPDVVGGVVQEQVFYADDARIPGAALHVPRGSAPDFESFSLDIVPQVAPGTAIENGGDSATSMGYAVDVHSDTTDNFVFTPVPGACPRIELPYDAARLAVLLGPGRESALQASHLTSVDAIGAGGQVLDPVGPVTVDLANHTLSFCVEHLSIYLANTPQNGAKLVSAKLYFGDTTEADLVDDSVTSLPTLVAGRTYDIRMRFLNTGTNSWTTNTHKLVAVDASIVAIPAGSPSWVTWSTCGIEHNCDTDMLLMEGDDNVAPGEEGAFSFKVKAPTTPAPMNFCLRSGSSAFFGECFSWDPHRYTSGTGGAPPSVCVPSTEVCNGADDDCDGEVDEEPPAYYPDHDHDGYLDLDAAYYSCSPPSDYFLDNGNPDDCCDLDDRAHRGQTSFFPGRNACGSFDYDCDGATGHFNDFIGMECGYQNLFGCSHDGWADHIPGCGETADLDQCYVPVITCSVRTVSTIQTCR